MKTDHTLTQARLREVIDYDESTGVFQWRSSGRAAGTHAGHRRRLQICIDGTARYANRLAWLYVHGEWPDGQVDHENQDLTDNRISNLRVVAGSAENSQNRSRPRVDNVAGRIGVSFDPRSGRYRARIMVDGKSRGLGFFATADAASDAYLTAKRKIHPFWIEAA